MRTVSWFLLALCRGAFAVPATEGLPGWNAPMQASPAAPAAARVPWVTVESPSPLVRIKVMVKAGSAQDPEGLEGLASLVGRLMVEGGFGDPKDPVTKDRLAEKTRPWGEGAYPSVSVSKEATTFSMTVPKEVMETYAREVLEPMFGRPLFAAAELDRVRAEALQTLSSNLRLQDIEGLGLVSLDNLIHEKTAYAHPDLGTAKGLAAIDVRAVRRFHGTHYGPGNALLAVSGNDRAAAESLAAGLYASLASGVRSESDPFPRRVPEPPPPAKGRDVLVVALPGAISTGLHAGFPLRLTRKDPDYWPLYVANVWFGTHRDGFSHLYKVLREERGYNYGDYSYLEHFAGRPSHFFPPPNQPRRYQYFSIWIRPVAHEYAAHVMRALTWELERFARAGLGSEECEAAKNKARVLYLSLAGTTELLLGSSLDDAFYGLDKGYLPGYLERVAAVTCDQINAAVFKHLQARDLRYVAVTQDSAAGRLVSAIAQEGPVWGKGPADYQIDAKEESGRKVYSVPEEKLEILRRDAVWANFPMDVAKDRIRVVPAGRMFETPELAP